VAWDQRGHGDSVWAELYSWEADVRDAAAVLDSLGPDPVPLVGHSKGATLTLRVADAWPHRVTRFVAIDGLPTRWRQPDVAGHERTRLLAAEVEGWLDHRRRSAEVARRPGTAEELAARRGRMNPRLSAEWLRYLVGVGARHDDDGWRWKIDPRLRIGGFGPWRPEWSGRTLPGLGMPVLAILATVEEPMGWPTTAADIEPLLPARSRLLAVPETGHFVHIEQPALVAEAVLEFLS